MQENGQAQRRILKVIFALSGNEVNGLAPVDLQRALDIANASTVVRDLQLLKDVGIAEQIAETGRWRLGPRMVQIARDYEVAIGKAAAKLRELEQRYTRSAA